MTMTEGAKREVEIACKRENPDRKEGEFDYGCACYESALKAFNCLMEDGHSGYSIGVTKQILNRLIDGKPLTPIEDTDDIWDDRVTTLEDGTKSYQCKRMFGLFKDVDKDGNVRYKDNDRFIKVDINDPSSRWHSGLVCRTMEEMFPIKMPYVSETYMVYCEDFLVDPKNGDFDTVGIYYTITPSGEKVEISRYFRESEDGWEEIDVSTYNARMMRANVRKEKESKND